MNYTEHYKTRKTTHSQTEQAVDTQIKNSAGGFSFAVDDWDRLDRFLILGSEGGTYYASEHKLTVENAKIVEKLIKVDGIRVVNTIVDISTNGRAPKNDAAIFALAMCSAAEDNNTRKAALQALPQVARIGTHLFQFAGNVEGFRGWGRALRTAVANWYQGKDVDKLAYQMVKYQQRGGWSHRDLLRLSHPKTTDADKNNLYAWAVGKDNTPTGIVEGFEKAKVATTTKEIVKLIGDYNLPRECVPTEFLKEKAVWDVLLQKMPMTAMIRNLGKMTSIGLIGPGTNATKLVASRLRDTEYLQKSRIHPMTVLTALRVYDSESWERRGNLEWKPEGKIKDALDDAFYGTFGNVTPTGKRHILALDVSGSMNSPCAGSEILTCREGSVAMALITANVEDDYEFMGFSDKFMHLDISPKMRLEDALKKVSKLPFNGTDCALPMMWAMGFDSKSGGNYWARNDGYTKTQRSVVKADVFCVYTDSETWAGSTHPHEALNQYRNQTGIPAKLVVVGMNSNGFTIADPDDAGMLDVVGFDTATPNIISEFVK